MTDLLIVVLIATAIWYLGAAAVVTEPIRIWIAVTWPGLTNWLNCPACSGFWYGVVLAIGATQIQRPILGLDFLIAPVVTGAVCLVCVPILAKILLECLVAVGDVLNPRESSDN